jgi:hypothetical protein
VGNDNVLHAVRLHGGVHGYLQADEDEGAEAENYRKDVKLGSISCQFLQPGGSGFPDMFCNFY